MSNNYKKFAKLLCDFLTPNAQISILDSKGKALHTFNQLVSEETPTLDSYESLSFELRNNRSLKAIRLPLDCNHSLEIIIETTALSAMQNFLDQYLPREEKKSSFTSWHEHINQHLQEYLSKKSISLNSLTATHKIDLIHNFYEAGIFEYKDAANYLATKLNVSRATIYNYLNQATQLKSIYVHQVDSFTDEPFSGNPAGVVLDADHLTDALMKKITREMNLSETSFVMKSKKADIKLRYFTPSGHEVKFCGHSTVGALYMIAHEKRLGIESAGQYPLTLETAVGIIPAEVKLDKDDRIAIQFQAPKIALIPTKITHQQISKALDININNIDTKQPVMFEKTNQDIFLTIDSLETLEKLQVNFKSAKAFAEKNKIVAFCLLCPESINKENQIHMRCFAPAVGIDEDPFTGSVLGGLSAYVTQNKLIDPRSKAFRVEQGHFIDRAGHVEIKLHKEAGELRPIIIAKARHFFSTEIKL